MSVIPQRPGGWWHDYVCPTHGTELVGNNGDDHLCSAGCRLSGDRYDGAFLALEHQSLAREARAAAHRFRRDGSDADRDRACELVLAYADLAARITAQGWSEKSEPWMLRGKLFAQALSEAQWAVGIADAIIALGPLSALTGSARLREMLDGLAATISDARRILVVDRDDPRSNYTAWLDAAGRLIALAQHRLGGPAPAPQFEEAVYAHMQIAVHSDGWEWEASTYYHVFVLRAYLLALRDVDPASIPADSLRVLRSMVDVLILIAAPDGFLPAMHDGPFDRVLMHREVLEIAVLSAQLLGDSGMDTIEAWARDRLGEEHDGLEDTLDNWFAGAPVATTPARAGSTHFADAGYVVLRSADDRLHAVLDAGPHGGAHGHLDKLGLYLYGNGERWQPAPGVPPYASALRHGYYARTIAHPTVRVDGADQSEATAEVIAWDAERSSVVTRADDAIEGVDFGRAVQLHGDLLVDVVRVRVRSGADKQISLGLRPGVEATITADGDQWHSTWGAGSEQLVGAHRASVASALSLSPGRGPSDDPSRLLHVADWSAHTSAIVFVSVYQLNSADPAQILRIRDESTAVHIDIHASDSPTQIEVPL